jgi:hypothetical protein
LKWWVAYIWRKNAKIISEESFLTIYNQCQQILAMLNSLKNALN